MTLLETAGSLSCETKSLFASLGLSAKVLQAVQTLGYENPTPIQAHGIPILLQGRDLIGSAQTGTGKTAAFGLPLLTLLEKPERGPRGLVLVPTRELAVQVNDSLQKFARYTCLRTALLYGGGGYRRHIGAP